ncbi:MAG TPA: hypothetical protein VHP33_40600 [Polyangiaceae bacterium]|nr:hypothetical protein [Polyangiaceae bacterium]
MKSSVFAAGAVLLYVALGCGSNDSDDGEGSGGKAGSSSAGSKATSGGSASGGTKPSGSAGTTTQTGNAGSSSTAMSPECQKYCDCHDKNCASSPIPDGKSCAEFCAGFTPDQMECRQIHCILVPDQPDNDHCTHSLGIIQCL